MTDRQQNLCNMAEKAKEMVLQAERWLWQHPQTGYTEWEADGYVSAKFEEMGYALVRAGNIPGFYTDIDTGVPGPMVAVMGELDALDLSGHPEAVNGMTHACGHHAQAAAMLGIAAALKEPGALFGLSGKIRLMLVPAEEMIQLEFREELRKKGTIKFNGGKPEFMARGFFDGVALSLMVHGGTGEGYDFACSKGSNGCMAKIFTYKGKAAHAGGSPHDGINAEYAALLGLQACNNLRETFRDDEHIRFHPIMKGVQSAVNIIPDEMRIESYVRGNSMEAILRENNKVNRALTGAALSMGAGLTLCDRPGYAPEFHDPELMALAEECCIALSGKDKVRFNYDGWDTGSSDFGDLTCVMPGVQFYCGGASGHGHGIDYRVTDPERLCVNSAKAQLLLLDALLSGGAKKAKHIIENYRPLYPSIKDYLTALDNVILDKEAVIYDEAGNAKVDFKN